jgi:hypothetical protein
MMLDLKERETKERVLIRQVRDALDGGVERLTRRR